MLLIQSPTGGLTYEIVGDLSALQDQYQTLLT